MKTFEELEEVVHSINEMEEIFKGVVILACHQVEIERFIGLSDRVKDILVKDVQRINGLCPEEPATCPDLLEMCKGALAALNQNKTFPADIDAAKLFLISAIAKVERKEE